MHTWKPPSFDAPLPSMPEPWSLDAAPSAAGSTTALTAVTAPRVSAQELQALKAKAHQEGFVRGLQEGLLEGRVQGEALGREEGLKAGWQEGRATGLEQGQQEGREQIAQLSHSLQSALDGLTQLPPALESSLADWVYQTACRLAGRDAMAREPFVQAVQEALMRLPRPGETLFLRIPSRELELWKDLAQEALVGIAVTLLEDSQLQPGHAYLEVAGTRVDVGAAARDALVRSALGLLPLATNHPG